MTIQSMTGYARAQGRDDARAWTWEVKSVNARGLDLRFRLPSGYDRLDPQARKLVAERFTRGNLSLGLTLNVERSGTALRLNEQALDHIEAALPAARLWLRLQWVEGGRRHIELAPESERYAAMVDKIQESVFGLP